MKKSLEEFSPGEVETRGSKEANSQVEPKKTFHFSTTANQERVNDLDRKQDELLEGKQATKDIVNSQGETVVTEGAVLTKDEIDQLKRHGPGVMVELSMNVK
ncbi:hypothetical protein LC065_10900 [Halobacillus litoralis]|uniref:hypothetical protein n=1 Tax=Halobacillus litoralis TaxID=45668 RepID=UPI001CFE4A75|nr:hypothetical protein [Halobacillus litoralis]WLR46118.1 hypothetical protein LC065_10900 [Halobacillus litoralis]